MVLFVTAAVALSVFTGGLVIPGILAAVQVIRPLIHSFLAAQIFLTIAAFMSTMLIIPVMRSFIWSSDYNDKEAAIQRECAEANGQIDYVNVNSRYNRSNAMSYLLFNTPLFVPPLQQAGVIAQLPHAGVIAQLPPVQAAAIGSPNQILQQVRAAKGNQACGINVDGENGLLTEEEIQNLKLCIKRGLADFPNKNPDEKEAQTYRKMIRELNHYVGAVGIVFDRDYGGGGTTPQELLRIHFEDGVIVTYEYGEVTDWLNFRIGNAASNVGRAAQNRLPGIERSIVGATYHYGLSQEDIAFITQTRSYLARPKVQAFITRQAAAALKAPVTAERVDDRIDAKDVKQDNDSVHKPLVA